MNRIKEEENKNFYMRSIFAVPRMVIPEAKIFIISISKGYWRKITYRILGGTISEVHIARFC